MRSYVSTDLYNINFWKLLLKKLFIRPVSGDILFGN